MTFEFIKEVDNTIVPTDEIDKMVCNEFGLAYNNLNKLGRIDYGHFALDYSSYGQDYISWYGLISVILSFGNIQGGKRTMAELLESYVFTVWHDAIDWPEDSIVLVAKLLKYLHKQGLCLLVSLW